MPVLRFLALAGIALAVLSAVADVAANARTQVVDGHPIERVTELNREALGAIEKHQYEKARGLLKQALDLCASSGLAEHPIAARTHVHMGVVILDGFKNRELGERQFAAALAIQPDITLTPSLATAHLQQAFDEARAAGSAAGPESRALLPEQPGSDEGGRDTAGSSSGAGFTRHTASTAERRGDDGTAGDDEEDAAAGGWFASLEVGSGFGYRSGGGELNLDEPAPGAVSGAWLGQVVPEVGYWYAPNRLLSAQGRIQVVTGPTEIDANGRTYSPAAWAFAIFAKASWLFGSDNLRPFVSAGVGGGQIRHQVTFKNLTDCGANRSQTCVDTVVAGPLLAEAGGGLFYKLTSSLLLELSTNVETAAPHFTLNLDLDGGVAFIF
jgi:hypothetical protein